MVVRCDGGGVTTPKVTTSTRTRGTPFVGGSRLVVQAEGEVPLQEEVGRGVLISTSGGWGTGVGEMRFRAAELLLQFEVLGGSGLFEVGEGR